MAPQSAFEWLRTHWSPDHLPNNKWVVVSPNGLVAEDDSLDIVVEAVKIRLDWNLLAFAFVTFDVCQ